MTDDERAAEAAAVERRIHSRPRHSRVQMALFCLLIAAVCAWPFWLLLGLRVAYGEWGFLPPFVMVQAVYLFLAVMLIAFVVTGAARVFRPSRGG